MARRTITLMTAMALAGGLVLGAVASATVAGKPLSEQQWRKTTNNICTQSDTLLAEAQETAFADVPPDGQPSIEQMAAYAEASEPIIQQRIDSIDALKEPKKLRAKVKKMLTNAQRELEAFVADPNRGFEGNPFTDTILAADKLKLKACGS
jgi:hypothetical protein